MMARQALDYSTRIKSILDYATTLNAQLLETAGLVAGVTTAADGIRPESLDRHIELGLSTPSSALEGQDRVKLDAQGTKLWNTCTRLLRTGTGQGENDGEAKLSHARVFAFCLLEWGAAPTRTDSSDDDVRVLKVALKTARTCIGLKQLELGLKILEKAAIREERLSHSDNEDNKGIMSRLSSDYYFLRISLAWEQNRIDLAEHMFSKVSFICLQQDPPSAERLADVLYDLGRNLTLKREYTHAEKWLTRASDVLSQPGIDHLSRDAWDLRSCVLHGLVRARLAQQTEPDQKTRDLLFVLKEDYQQDLAVLSLTLDVISKQHSPDARQYYDCLSIFINTALVTESNFDLIIGHIYKLRSWDARQAAKALKQLVLQRLTTQKERGILERGIVTLIWMETSSPELDDGLERLTSVMTALKDDWGVQISAEATHASLILIWKKVGKAFEEEDYSITEKWCQLAQHPLFDNVGETNKSKIQRKIISCALESRNFQMARQSFLRMSEKGKTDPLTRYLMYRVALQADDIALERNCLEVLYNQDTDTPTYLLACISEAQRSGKKHQAAIVLQQLVDKLDGQSLYGVHLPALLRCTVRLLVGELADRESSDSAIIEQVCKVFESFKVAASQNQLNTGHISVSELEWFSRNTYNLALQHCTNWKPEHVLRLLNTCIETIDLYPTDIGSEALSDISLRKLLCDFLAGIIHVAQARLQDGYETQRNHYLDARIHIQRFRAIVHEQFRRSDEKTQTELRGKHQTLLAFDFEASVRLKQWNSLSEIIDESRTVGDEKLYSVFVDAVLCSGAPIEEISEIFQRILRVVREQDTHDTSKISRWLRCLFQLALGSDVGLAEEVLEHAYNVARELPRTKMRSDDCISYPQEELEWLSTTAFNRAVDFYLTSNDATSRRWATKALDIAQLMSDRHALFNVLHRKLSCLKWGG